MIKNIKKSNLNMPVQQSPSLPRWIIAFVLSFASILCSFSANAGWDVSCNWNPITGNSYTYTYTHTSTMWASTCQVTGGTVTGESKSKFSSTASFTINWSGTGIQTIQLYIGTTEIAYHGVAVGCSSIAGPTAGVWNPVNGTSSSCTPTTFSISSSHSNTVWYTSASGGSFFYSGQNYTTGTIYATTTYHIARVSYSDDGVACETARTPVTLTITSPPAAPSYVVENQICQTGSSQITASPGSGGNNVKWYDASNNYIQTGTIYNTPNIHTTTTYQISTINTSTGCEGSKIPVTVNVYPRPAAPSVTNGSSCGPGYVTLSASAAAGLELRWYDNSENYITSGNSISPWLSASATYRVRAYNTSTGCISSSYTAVTATINPIPGAPSGSGGRCGPGAVNMSATIGANGTGVRWYDAQSGGNLLSTSTSYTTQSISSSTTYYVSSVSATCEGSRVSITATITPLAGTPSFNVLNTICGSGTAEITASPGTNGSDVYWYNGSDPNVLVNIGNTYVTPNISSTTEYLIRSSGAPGFCSSPTIPLTVIVHRLPIAPSASSVSRCGSGQVTLSATPPSGSTVEWYSNSEIFLSPSNPYTPSISSTTTYRVKSKSTAGCLSSSSTTVTATVNNIPANPSLTPGTICANNTITLQGTSGTDGNTLRWYSALNGGTSLEQATSYTTPPLSVSTTYFASSYNTSTMCESAGRTSVLATVNPLPTAPSYDILQPVCGSGSTTIAAGSVPAGYLIKWYNTGQNQSIYTGSDYGTSVITATTSWQYTSTNVSTGCESSRATATVPVSPIPAAPIAYMDAVKCVADTMSVKATPPGGDVNMIKWYSSLTGGAELFTGTKYTTPLIEYTTVYYAASYNPTTQCASTVRIPVKAKLNPKPTGIIYQEAPVYGSGTVKLRATNSEVPPDSRFREDPTLTSNSSVTVRWFSSEANAEANAPVLAQNFEYTTPLLQGDTKYYARIVDTETGCKSDPISTEAKVTPYIISQSVKTEMIRIPVKSEALIATLTPAQKNTTITYMDGVGRVHQQVIKAGAPNGGDIIQPVDFDSWGRASKTYLPFVSDTADGSFRSNYLAKQAAFYKRNGDKIANDNYPFAITVYEDSPLGRVVEQTNVGEAWKEGSGHTNTVSYTLNTGESGNHTEEVRQLNSSGTSIGLYAANKLSRVKSVDADGNIVISYSDPDGKLILSRKQLGETIGTGVVEYLETYYVYNDFGNITMMIQPKGVAALRSGGWAMTQAIKDQFVFEYVYDKYGRVIEKKVPGAGWSYIVYDQLNRPVLMQDQNLRFTNQWNFMKYDIKGRVVLSGLFTSTSTRQTLQNSLNALNYDGADKHFEKRQSATTVGYSNQAFPTTSIQILTANYYDVHDFNYDLTPEQSYTSQSLAGEKPQGPSWGRATGSQSLIPGTTNWLVNYVFYDSAGRVIQTRSNNHMYSFATDLHTIVYDFEKVLQTKTYHHAGGTRTSTVVNEYEYDTKGRVKKVFQKNNNDAKQLVMQLEYNRLGQVVDKKLHGTGTAGSETFLQSVDYRYTINGQLASINNAALDNGTDINDESNDYFGMEILYNTADATGLATTPQYNGNIAAIKWKSSGTGTGVEGQRSYAYTYDKSGKLKFAEYSARTASGWNGEVNAQNESMTYDHNGNIKTLTRNQRKHQLTVQPTSVVASYTNEQVDNLTYNYAATENSNSLLRVGDGATVPGGFTNGANTDDDFTYDAAGNLTRDKNKGIDSVKYNFMGKPVRIKFTDGKVIKYLYDAGGNKLKQEVINGSTTAVTDYVNGFVYEGGVLSFFGSAGGRVVNKAGALEYQYAISDHQGNTRVVFSSATPAPYVPQASFESSVANVDRDDVLLSDLSEMNSTPSGTMSQRLIGGYNSQVGATANFKVYPGDKVKAEVYAKYRSTGSNPGNLAQFAAALTGAFGMSPGGSVEAQNAYASMNAYGQLAADAGRYLDDDASPKGFVTILLFDKNYNFVDAAWDQLNGTYSQSPTTIKDPFDTLRKEITVKEEGYAYIFLSNENPTQVDIHFDDLKITHTKTNIIQYNEYYPFGLQTSTSWTREGSSNNYLYNEASDMNVTSGWYDLPFRNYDAALGRFMQVDPLATWDVSTSPFAYAGNNPAFFNDPLGLYVSANGYTDGQLRSMYRSNRGSYTSFGDWAVDNIDPNSMIGREINGGDGNMYTVNDSGQIGYWRDYAYGPGKGDIMVESRQSDFITSGRGGFFSGFVDGFADGGKSTWNFVKSLGTAEGWENVGRGLIATAQIASQVPNPTQMQFQASVVSYVENIPNMTAYEAGHDLGFGAEKVVETILISKGASAVTKVATAAKGGGRVFWSGGEEAMKAAANYAKANGGKTLEMTLGGRVMTTLNPVLPRSISSPIWNSLSTNFAKGATGSVNVFHNVNGVRLQSIWAQTEYGILRGNNVNIFYHNVFP